MPLSERQKRCSAAGGTITNLLGPSDHHPPSGKAGAPGALTATAHALVAENHRTTHSDTPAEAGRLCETLCLPARHAAQTAEIERPLPDAADVRIPPAESVSLRGRPSRRLPRIRELQTDRLVRLEGSLQIELLRHFTHGGEHFLSQQADAGLRIRM
jgi:hypothetical protein